ncbi:MAG: ParA family protein [Pseudomonadota bacterium]|nr:ParA family protein [Pseudomonadota bacterium]
MHRLAVYSVKGGVGKTAAAVNLAFAGAQSGYRTLLIDLDPQGASSYYLRTEPSGDVEDRWYMGDRKQLLQGIRASDFPRLHLLPSNLQHRTVEQVLGTKKKSDRQLRRRLAALEGRYDLVVMDAPPGIGLLAENVFAAVDAVLVPVIPTTLSARTLAQLVEHFQVAGLPSQHLHAFFSMAQVHKRMHREFMQRLRAQYGFFLDAEIPFSVDVENMGVRRAPLLASGSNRPAALAYRRLWDEVMQTLVPVRAPV